MDAGLFKTLIEAGQAEAIESAWNQAVEAGAPLEELTAGLEALVAAGSKGLAEVLAWTLLVRAAEQGPPEAALKVAKAALSAVPDSDELRSEAYTSCERVHGRHEHFAAIADACGLLAGVAPRRAFRALETCLAIVPGSFLVNRFDHRVLRVLGYRATTAVFEVADAGPGAPGSQYLDVRTVGDEFELADRVDFRVLCRHFPDELTGLLEGDPAAVLIGMCLARGGAIDAVALKDVLVPKYLPAEQWSSWWGRARTAAKRSPQLLLEGRSPVVVSYHPGGMTLEQELAPAGEAARMPLERLEVLRQYARQLRDRKLKLDTGFAGAIIAGLAEQARTFQADRPADALAAALGVGAGAALGMPAPRGPYPTPAEILTAAARPAEAVAALADAELWAAALEALAVRPDAPEQFRRLLGISPAGQIDLIALRLSDPAGQQAVAAAVAEALAAPAEHLELFLWLWKGPARPPSNLPGKVEMLSRLLAALQEVDHDWNIDPQRRKTFRHRMRAALSAGDYAAYRQAVAEMDLPVAGTFKGRIERNVGLAQAVREDMMNILRESFYALFVKAKVVPWADENVLWTTPQALHRREGLLKELVDVKMLENSRAIGAAAEHGDLSENSEWKSALEERDLLRARVAQMQRELSLARIIQPEDVPGDSVGVGSRVTLRRQDDGRQIELTFLGPWDSDPEKGVYSYQTALGQELMGKSVGESVNVKIEGLEGQYRIVRLASAVTEERT